MWMRNPLDDILSSKAKTAVLRVICGALTALNVREIARRAGTDAGHTSRVLRELAASGLLIGRGIGRATTYELAAPDLPLTRQLAGLFEAEAQRFDEAIGELAAALPETISVVLFGSEARGEAHAGSDTDLLIVVPEKASDMENRLSEACMAISSRYGLALSWQLADLAEIRAWEASDSALWRNILDEGVRLRGEPLRRLQAVCQTGETG